MDSTAESALWRAGCWFRSGGEVSEQQWRDVTALLRVQAGRLDEPYLYTWAVTLGVDDLLARAREL